MNRLRHILIPVLITAVFSPNAALASGLSDEARTVVSSALGLVAGFLAVMVFTKRKDSEDAEK